MARRALSLAVDANIVASTVVPLPYSVLADERLKGWKRDGVLLVAPVLFEYELTTILRRAVTARLIPSRDASEAMRRVLAVNVRCLPPTVELHERALIWAERLRQSKAYDAHYLALAEQERAEFWTADERLANGARQAGATWVHWIGDPSAEE